MTSNAKPTTPARIEPGADSSDAARPAVGDGVTGQGQPELRHHARDQVIGLTAQFLLGMAVNLLGVPSEATGAAHIASTVLLVGHVLVALGLIAGAILTVRAATRASSHMRTQAIWGATVIAGTVTAGILTAITRNDWWSYAMALGFLVSLLIYGRLVFLPATRPAPR